LAVTKPDCGIVGNGFGIGLDIETETSADLRRADSFAAVDLVTNALSAADSTWLSREGADKPNDVRNESGPSDETSDELLCDAFD
jgi:hypothetical protein